METLYNIQIKRIEINCVEGILIGGALSIGKLIEERAPPLQSCDNLKLLRMDGFKLIFVQLNRNRANSKGSFELFIDSVQ